MHEDILADVALKPFKSISGRESDRAAYIVLTRAWANEVPAVVEFIQLLQPSFV
jgi:hypothetical protein